jgi:hypothetical protein
MAVIFISCLDLLAQVFRRAADHQAGDEDRQMANTSMP